MLHLSPCTPKLFTPTHSSMETQPRHVKRFTHLSTGPPPKHSMGHGPSPTTQCYPTTDTQNQRGMRGVFDGKGLNPFNHHFLPAGIKPR